MTKRYNTPHRTHPIKAMLTEEEYADFDERCRIYGLSHAEMIRQSLDKVAIHPIIKVSVVDDHLLSEIGRMTAEFGKAGSNLNQIAKVLNEFHAPYPELADDVKTAVSNLANLKYEVLKKVGDAIGNDKTYKL